MAESASGWSDYSIAVTSGGSPHICFTAVPSDYTDQERRTQVCYVGPTAGDPEEVSQGLGEPGAMGATGECAIAVDPTGRPTIVYSEYSPNDFDPTNPGLKIVRGNLAVKPLPDGAWLDMPEIDLPGDNDYYGLHPDIAFNEDSIPQDFFGCAGVAEINNRQDALQTIGYAGHRHHTSVTPGQVAAPVQEAFEKYLGYEVTRV